MMYVYLSLGIYRHQLQLHKDTKTIKSSVKQYDNRYVSWYPLSKNKRLVLFTSKHMAHSFNNSLQHAACWLSWFKCNCIGKIQMRHTVLLAFATFWAYYLADTICQLYTITRMATLHVYIQMYQKSCYLRNILLFICATK